MYRYILKVKNRLRCYVLVYVLWEVDVKLELEIWEIIRGNICDR